MQIPASGVKFLFAAPRAADGAAPKNGPGAALIRAAPGRRALLPFGCSDGAGGAGKGHIMASTAVTMDTAPKSTPRTPRIRPFSFLRPHSTRPITDTIVPPRPTRPK